MNATYLLAGALALGLPVRAAAAETPGPYYRTTLGLSAGWGAPYGWGLDVGHFFSERLEGTVGGGLAASGAKAGVGARYFLLPQRATSPYFGLNAVYSGRLRDQNASVSGDVPYDVRPGAVLHLRSGLRWQSDRVGFLGTLGYGLRLSGYPIRFHEPAEGQAAPRPETVRTARAFAPGGLEISFGLSIGLGPRR
ncbi:hypothetical protein [Hymenobacter jeollabukensis]|uniref:Outer membrane protein beta-barrel domain-containing protein n=1 Tax=Hymenobacter jeollabukensis TaxID=2025313 RepID=A0A5R8WKH4_9BACT|nr:hypothetical protein [Hymenobacter jeollabukensis]TLM89532.1 hypothetical protein FDY95_20900 [Hymenobacter jeollabukensis]